MGHTRPDWSWMGKLETVYSLQDFGELAVRLGSIDSFDRRGNVIFLDGFENGKGRWKVSYSGTGAFAGLGVDYVKDGAYALKLVSNSDGVGTSAAAIYSPVLVLSKLGLEFALGAFLYNSAWQVDLRVNTGVKALTAGLRYDYSSKALQYYASSGLWVTLATVDLWEGAFLQFHVFKLVIDVQAKEYVRLLVDNIVYSLSGCVLYSKADTAAAHVLIQVSNESKVGSNNILGVDNIIFTQNED